MKTIKTIVSKLKIPSPYLLYACIAAFFFSGLGVSVEIPKTIVVLSQIFIGIIAGSQVHPGDLYNMKYIILPFVFLIVVYFSVVLCGGLFIHHFSGLDLKTSFFVMIPSGMTDMAISADCFGADISAVVLLQTLRIIIGTCMFPAVILFLTPNHTEALLQTHQTSSPKRKTHFFLITVSSVTAFLIHSFFGSNTAFLSALIVCVIYTHFSNESISLPRFFSIAAQIITGLNIGSRLNIREFSDVRLLILPAMTVIITYLFIIIIFGPLMSGLRKCSLREGMLTFTAAGASNMALISADMKIHSIDLIILQSLRWTFVAAFFPQLFNFISDIL